MNHGLHFRLPYQQLTDFKWCSVDLNDMGLADEAFNKILDVDVFVFMQLGKLG